MRFTIESYLIATETRDKIASELKNAGIQGTAVHVDQKDQHDSLLSVYVTLHPGDLLTPEEYATTWRQHTPSIGYKNGDKIEAMTTKYYKKLPAEDQAKVRLYAAELEIEQLKTDTQAINHDWLKVYTMFTPGFLDKLKSIMKIVKRNYYVGYFDYYSKDPYFTLYTIPTED